MQIRAPAKGETYLKMPKDGCGDGLLMVFKIDEDSGAYGTVYNGDLQRAWNKYGHLKGSVTLERFRDLQKAVEQEDIIPEK